MMNYHLQYTDLYGPILIVIVDISQITRKLLYMFRRIVADDGELLNG